MEGRGPEFLPVEKDVTDDGFSEKKLAKAAEGVVVDNSQVKKRKPLSTRSVRKVRFPVVLRKRQNPSKKVISRRDKI